MSGADREMVMPATAAELLTMAEDTIAEYASALDADPRTAPALRAWPTFEQAAHFALTATVGPRRPLHPVDFAIATYTTRRPGTPTRAPDRSPAADVLARAGRLIGAAGDLIAGTDLPAATAHAAAARIAAIVATAAHITLTSGAKTPYPPSHPIAHLVHAQRAATRILDAHTQPASTSDAVALSDVIAQPTTITYGPPARLAAATLAYRRTAEAADPCSEVFILNAVTTIKVLAAAALQVRALYGGAPGADDFVNDLRDTARAWQDVARFWHTHIAPGRRPEALRLAADEVHAACDALSPADHSARDSRSARRPTLGAVSRAIHQMLRLHETQSALPRQLSTAGRIMVPARTLPATVANLQRRQSSCLVPAGSLMGLDATLLDAIMRIRGVQPTLGRLTAPAPSGTNDGRAVGRQPTLQPGQTPGRLRNR